MAQRTPTSARLPQVSLEDAIPISQALVELAAPSSKARIAQHLGASPAAGGFRAKFAAARYYGLIEKNGDKYSLTRRGTTALGNNEEEALQARREAVMATSFGPVLMILKGREPNEGTIAARLEDDFQVPPGSASNALAGILVRAATAAKMITNGRFDVGAIEGASGALRQGGPSPQAGRRNGASGKQEPAPTEKAPEKIKAKVDEKPGAREVVKPEPPLGTAVQVVVRIDASDLTPQEIAELVRALREDS